MQLLGTCSDLLVVLLQHHGIQTQENEGIVTIPDGPPYQFALPVFKLSNCKRCAKWRPDE